VLKKSSFSKINPINIKKLGITNINIQMKKDKSFGLDFKHLGLMEKLKKIHR
jgi:hypothetical protein